MVLLTIVRLLSKLVMAPPPPPPTFCVKVLFLIKAVAVVTPMPPVFGPKPPLMVTPSKVRLPFQSTRIAKSGVPGALLRCTAAPLPLIVISLLM